MKKINMNELQIGDWFLSKPSKSNKHFKGSEIIGLCKEDNKCIYYPMIIMDKQKRDDKDMFGKAVDRKNLNLLSWEYFKLNEKEIEEYNSKLVIEQL